MRNDETIKMREALAALPVTRRPEPRWSRTPLPATPGSAEVETPGTGITQAAGTTGVAGVFGAPPSPSPAPPIGPGAFSAPSTGPGTFGAPLHPSPAEPPWACVFTPASAGQIHHLPLELVRRDIAGDRPGVPLMLRVRVLDARTTDPVTGAVLDVRHRDATGETILRGAQVTDQEGYAEFRTVHPGWLPGRAAHLSAEVHVGARLAGGRSVAHAGRLYLPESVTAQVAQLRPYLDIPAARTTNAADRGYAVGGEMHVVPRDRFDLASGLLATITIGVGTPE